MGSLITEANINVGEQSEGMLEENLASFAQRFPVSGRVVLALSSEVGGILHLAGRLDRCGMWNDVQHWIESGEPCPINDRSIHDLFSDSTINEVARKLQVPPETVEIQAALGIPKFFTSLAQAEDEDLGLGFGAIREVKYADSGGFFRRDGFIPH